MGTPIEVQAQMAGWPTPRQADGEKNVRSAAGSASEMERKGGPQDMSMAVSLCGWQTPTAQQQRKSARAMTPSTNNGRRSGGGQSSPPGLEQEAEMANGIIAPDVERSTLPQNWPPYAGPIRYTVHGEMLTGSSALTQNGAQLNPALPRWLQAFPEAWERSAPGWESWQFWQALTAAAFEMQSDTA